MLSLPLIGSLLIASAGPGAVDQESSDAPGTASEEAEAEDESGAEVDADELLSAEDCPAVFGPGRTHATNQDYRKLRLHEFSISDERVEITHSVGRWSTPGRVKLTGVSLRGVQHPEEESAGEARVALVELSEALEDLCTPGIYAVSADHALGRAGRILAVDDRGVLIEKGGELAFLPWKGHPLPDFTRMVWRSSYDVVLDQTGGKASASKGKKRSKKKKKKAKKKRPKKKKKKKSKRR